MAAYGPPFLPTEKPTKMKNSTSIILAALLAGCEPMTYEQVQAASKYCTDRGMAPRFYDWVPGRGQPTGRVGDVACVDKDGHVFAAKGPK
jgi:hypothetical protein